MIKALRPLALAASLLMALPAMAVTTVDFKSVTPSQVTAWTAGNTLTVGAYRFTSNTATAPTVTCVGGIFCNLYRGLTAPTLGNVINVSRVDGALFSLNEIDTFVSGTLQTGYTDVELRPYNAAGVRGAQLNMLGVAGQYLTKVTVDLNTYPVLSNMKSFDIMNGSNQLLVDHYNALVLSSPADIAAVPESSTALMLGAGFVGIALMRRSRTRRNDA